MPIEIPQPSILPESLTFSTFLSGSISLFIVFAFITSFFYLVWGGFNWITSGGDEAGIQAAKNRILAALVGLTIVVATWGFFQLVESFFGVTIFKKEGFKIPVIVSSSTDEKEQPPKCVLPKTGGH